MDDWKYEIEAKVLCELTFIKTSFQSYTDWSYLFAGTPLSVAKLNKRDEYHYSVQPDV